MGNEKRRKLLKSRERKQGRRQNLKENQPLINLKKNQWLSVIGSKSDKCQSLSKIFCVSDAASNDAEEKKT